MNRIPYYIVVNILLVLPLSAGQSLFAQKRSRPLTKRELTEQNLDLTRRVDSLQRRLAFIQDSINMARRSADSLSSSFASHFDPFPLRGVQAYDKDRVDSLISLFSEQTKLSYMQTLDTADYSSPLQGTDMTDEQYMEKLSRMGTVMQIPYNQAVRTFIERYSVKWKSIMPQVVGLCYYYMPIFEESLSKYDLPLELKVLPIIESLLNPTATSRAGARGLWQFILSAARGYDLRVDNFIDERLDPYKASDAAARLLRDNYEVFGDWALAISAYNCGMGGVQRAIDRAGGKTDYWSIYPYLPRETRNYVPSFVGMLYALTYRDELGIEADRIPMPLSTDTFDVAGKVHLGQVSSLVGIPLDDLRALNPQYYRDIIPDDRPTYPLILPHKYSSVFAQCKDSVATHKASEFLTAAVLKEPAGQKVTGTSSSRGGGVAYKVRSGDTLSRIASRNHCTVKQLKSWNNLRSDRLRVGQVLYIY